MDETRDRPWWVELPRGYYALEDFYVNDDVECTCTGKCVGECFECFPVTLTTFQRTRNGFRTGRVYRLPEYEQIPQEDRYLHESPFSLDDLRDLAEYLVQRADELRARYGRFFGKCGACGRTLSDPESKLLGLGPDCGGRRG